MKAMMLAAHLLLTAAVMNNPLSTQQTIQTTSGWCSPIISNVVGNVTVTCIGVDPRALAVLNRKLSRTKLKLGNAIEQANHWANLYHSLEESLRDSDTNEGLSKRAEEYLHQGDLDRAKAILDRILENDEHEEVRIASDHYKRGLVSELQFKQKEALTQYARAYQIQPDSVKYGNKYAELLSQENEFTQAESILDVILGRARAEAEKNPDLNRPALAEVLTSQAQILSATARFDRAEADYQESLFILREIRKSSPSSYALETSTTLRDLGLLFWETGRLLNALGAYTESIAILQTMPPTEPNRIALAGTLNDLAVLYTEVPKLGDAVKTFQRSADLLKQLSKRNSIAFDAQLATVLDNIGHLHLTQLQFTEAEKASEEALDIVLKMKSSDPEYDERTEAQILNTLGHIYGAEGQTQKAYSSFEKAVAIYRPLFARNPTVFAQNIAVSLRGLGMTSTQLDRKNDAKSAYQESVQALRVLAETNFSAAATQLAETLDLLWKLCAQSGDETDAEKWLQQAIDVYRRSSHVREFSSAAFAPQEGEDLQYLALLYTKQGDLERSGAIASEAAAIFRKLVVSNPTSYGDSLAMCLLVQAWSVEKRDHSRACFLIDEAAKQPALKANTKQRTQVERQRCTERQVPGAPK